MSKRRLSSILALDVVGYSQMMQRDGAATLTALNRVYRSIVRPAVEASDGRVVKLLGDGALAEFQSASEALACAIRIQRALAHESGSDPGHAPIRLRAGLHAGDVVVEGGDVFGECVNVAVRLQAAAPPGGIFASRGFCDLVGSGTQATLLGAGLHSLKGIARPIEVVSVELTDARATPWSEQLARSQRVRFCTTQDGVRLAWTEVGEGPPVVKAPNWISHLDLDWRNPGIAPLTGSIARNHRLVRFDARGNGLSDWDVGELSFDRFVDDLECVFDAAGIERAPILALSQGCAVAAALAARRPERVSGIVMIGGFPQGRNRRGSARDQERATALAKMMAAGWDEGSPSLRDLMAQLIVPGASEEQRRVFADDMRRMITPENMGRFRQVVDDIDITALLGSVSAPCLVLHCQDDRMQPIEQGRLFAAGLPNARFIAYDSVGHLVTENDPVWPQMERDIDAFLREQET